MSRYDDIILGCTVDSIDGLYTGLSGGKEFPVHAMKRLMNELSFLMTSLEEQRSSSLCLYIENMLEEAIESSANEEVRGLRVKLEAVANAFGSEIEDVLTAVEREEYIVLPSGWSQADALSALKNHEKRR